jgi:type IV pilus assembly protein PilE
MGKQFMLKEGALASTREAGFTLVELMITVAIVSIIATIAATSYTSQVQQSRRTDARSALLDIAGREEKLFSTANAYSAAATDLGYTGAFPMTVGSGYYQVTVTVPDPAQTPLTPTTYIISAVPIGPQTSDGSCQQLTINQLGVQTATPGTTQTCWGN